MLLFVNTTKSYVWILPVTINFFYSWNTINKPMVRFAPAKSSSWKSITKSEVRLLIVALFLRSYYLEFSLFRDFFSLSPIYIYIYIYTREKFVSNIEVALVKFLWFIFHSWCLYRRFKRNNCSNARARSIMHCLLILPMPHEKVLCDLKFSECCW